MGLANLVEHLVQNYKNYLIGTAEYAIRSTVGGFIGGVAAGYYVATKYAANVIYTSLAAIGGFFVTKEAIYIPGHLSAIYKFFFGKGKKETKPVAEATAAPSGNLVPAPAT